MLRNPSIHLTKTDLNSIFKELGITVDIELFMNLAYKKRLKGRYLIVPKNKKMEDKLKRLHKNEMAEVELFNRILDSTRMLMGHKHIPKIEKGSSQYELLKEVSIIASEFSESFDLGESEGFHIFCKIGIQIMGNKYALNKFKYHKENIFKHKEVIDMCSVDSDKDFVDTIINQYSKRLTSIGVNYKVENVSEYAEFLYTKNQIKPLGIDIKDWITSQFSEMEFLNVLPNPNQLHGDNAMKRYKQWLIKSGKPEQNKIPGYDPTDFLKKFKS